MKLLKILAFGVVSTPFPALVILTLFYPKAGSIAYIVVAAILGGFVFGANREGTVIDNSDTRFTAEEVEVIERYHLFFRYRMLSRYLSAAFSGMQLSTFVIVPFLLFKTQYIQAVIIAASFYFAGKLSALLNPRHFIAAKIRNAEKRDSASATLLMCEMDTIDAVLDKTHSDYMNQHGLYFSGLADDTELLAERGDANAQFNLGRAYWGRDSGKAVEWFRKSAEQGHAKAQGYLGDAYSEGEGVPKDSAKAAEWYKKSAQQGEAISQFNLGIAYWNGGGVLKDSGKAVEWFKMAAEQGHEKAQCCVGTAYRDGEGVPRDMVLAYAWFDLAAKQGVKAAKKDRDIAQKLLSPSDLSEAKMLTSNWKPGSQLKRTAH